MRSRKPDIRARKGQRRRKKTRTVPLLTGLFLVVAMLFGLLLYLTATAVSNSQEMKDDSTLLADNKKPVTKLLRKGNTNQGGVDAVIDEIVSTLINLACMPLDELQELLEGDKSHNSPFQLDKLQDGICPYSSASALPKWLPPRPPAKPSKWFDKLETQNKPIVAAYYEHLSKAGGTSFCTLAMENMARNRVPDYYCMPSKPNMIDARVGSWTPAELEMYFKEKPNRLVSNEWEPFNLEFMKHFYQNKEVQLVFVTSIRNPINRLLSAYKFWGVLHNPDIKKPSFELWLQRVNQRAKRWKILSGDFMANVGRFNFATWKFSGGAIPVTDLSFNAEKNLNIQPDEDIRRILAEKHMYREEWRQPFETAVRMLSKFDLIIPMEELSQDPQPVTDILGWNDFSKSHVVPTGKVLNNKGSTALPPHQYDLLWQANALDYILYYWSMAIYLTRLHCAELIL